MGFRDHLPERDGLLSALLVLEAVVASGGSLDALLREVEAEAGTAFYRRRDYTLSPDRGRALVEKLDAAPPDRIGERSVSRRESLDGRKYWLGDGAWVLIRASGTEPVLRVYVEAETAVDVDQLHAAAEALVGRTRRDGRGEPAVMDLERIRNFCIIAHIDHGKSTLADRLLELTGTLDPREMQRPGPRRHGPRARARHHDQGPRRRLHYPARDGETYKLNLIDTPGHVDFTYEVSRSLAACEGAILVVDASQGVEAQTLANFYLALEQDLTLVPGAQQDRPAAAPTSERHDASSSIDLLGIERRRADPAISAKAGTRRRGPARGDRRADPAADGRPRRAAAGADLRLALRPVPRRGRATSGSSTAASTPGTKIRLMSNGQELRGPGGRRLHAADGCSCDELQRRARSATSSPGSRTWPTPRIGDTITDDGRTRPRSRCPGYREVKPMVFSRALPGRQPRSTRPSGTRSRSSRSTTRRSPSSRRPRWRSASASAAASSACSTWRSSRSGSSASTTSTSSPPPRASATVLDDAPTARSIEIDNPAKLPPAGDIARSSRSRIVAATIIAPTEYLGAIMKLAAGAARRASGRSSTSAPSACTLTLRLPLAEIVLDFYDRLKSAVARLRVARLRVPRATRPSDLVKLDILLNGEPVDALSFIVHRDKAVRAGARPCRRSCKELIPRQLFEVAIQAAIGGKVIARETVRAAAQERHRQVLRRRHHPQAQAPGEAEGRQETDEADRPVEIPQEAFLAVLRS